MPPRAGHTVFPSCGVSSRTVSFMSNKMNVSMELMYASLQLLHTDARESTVAAMMKGLAPGCGLCCEDSIRTKVWPLMEATVRALEGEWLTARDEWIHHPNNKMYKSVLVAPVYNSFDIIGSGDTSPIKCVSTIKDVHQPKYAGSVLKEFSIATHTGLVIYVSDVLYTGSSSDGIILENELLNNEELRTLLTKYGLLLDGGFHPTTVRKEVRAAAAEDPEDPYRDKEGEIEIIPSSASDDSSSPGDGLTQAKLLFPVRKPKIWPRHLDAHQSLEEYNANAEEMLELNERHGFVRARIEHRYGDSGIGHFSGLLERRWRHDVKKLLWALKFVFIARNIETHQTHGPGGAYHNVPPSDDYFKSAPINRKRFKRPVDKATKKEYPLPPLVPKVPKKPDTTRPQAQRMCSKCELATPLVFCDKCGDLCEECERTFHTRGAMLHHKRTPLAPPPPPPPSEHKPRKENSKRPRERQQLEATVQAEGLSGPKALKLVMKGIEMKYMAPAGHQQKKK